MKRTLFISVMIVMATIFILAEVSPYDKYITGQDISKISGIAGITKVPKDPSKGAGGDLNFADPKGKMVFLAMFRSFSDYAKFKPMTQYYDHAEKVDGTGMEVLIGPKAASKADALYVMTFAKGQHTVTISTFFVAGAFPMKPILDVPKMKEVAKLIASRL